MSDNEAEQFAEEMQSLRTLTRLGWGVIVGAFMMGGWVAVLQMKQITIAETVTDANTHIKNHGTELNRIGLWQAGVEGSRYTSLDASRDKTLLQQQLTEHDKRLTRIEDSITRIEKGIERIEGKLGTKP
jgi:hypothetical protein